MSTTATNRTSYADGQFSVPSQSWPSASSQLDTRETNVNPPISPDRDIYQQRRRDELSFRHSCWSAHRLRIALAMPEADIKPARRERFLRCGCVAWVVQHPDYVDRYAVRSAHCRDRFCIPCAREKAFRVAQNVLKHVQHRRLRFITLTLRHSDLPLNEQLDLLLRSFRALRSTPRWKCHTDGGAAFLELKLARDNRHWHPHLHILHEGSPIDKGSLAQDWHRITKTSYIVDIRAVHSRRHVVHYVTKYSAKPIGLALTSHREKLTESLQQLTARRLMLTFGTWRGFRLCQKADPVDWLPIAPLTQLITRARLGDDYAITVLAHLKGTLPWQTKRKHPKTYSRPPPASASTSTPGGKPSAPPVATP